MRATSEISSYGWAYSIYTDTDYDNGDYYTIPEGEELIACQCSWNAAVVQVYDGGAWNTMEVAGTVPISMATDKFMYFAGGKYSFGGVAVGSIRIGTPGGVNETIRVITRKWEQI